MLVKELWDIIREEEKRREWKSPVRLSSTGKCPQAMNCQLIGIPPEPLEPRTKLLFRVGDHTEAEVKALAAQYLEGTHNKWKKFYFGDRIEIPNDEEPRIFYRQVEIELVVPRWKKMDGTPEKEPIIIKGHMDGLGWPEWSDPYVIEIKSMNGYAFAKLQQGEIDESYMWQIQAYMECTGIKKCLFIGMDKETSDLSEQIVLRDEKYDCASRWRMMLSYSSDIVQPQKLAFTEVKKTGKLKIGFPCSYCSYRNICFNNVQLDFKPNKDRKGRIVQKKEYSADSCSTKEEIIKKQKEFVADKKPESKQQKEIKVEQAKQTYGSAEGFNIMEKTMEKTKDI
mgnify:CR=1 FL=1